MAKDDAMIVAENLYYILVQAIKDYVDCLSLKTMWVA